MRLADVGPFLPFPVNHGDPPLEGLVMHAEDAAWTGNWIFSNWSGPFLGDGYVHDGNTDKGTKRLVFTPDLPHAGPYEIRLAYVPCENRATGTPVTVHTAHGLQTVHLNQQQTPPIDSLFVSLGTFQLGIDAGIVIRNDHTNGYVVINAIQLIPRE